MDENESLILIRANCSISDKLTGHSGFFSVMVPAVTGSGRGRERDSGREPRLGRPGHSGGSVVTRGHCVMSCDPPERTKLCL